MCESEFPVFQQAEIVLNNLHKNGGLTEKEKEEAIKEIYRAKRFGIMTCGVSVAGNHTLLNGIAGSCVLREESGWKQESVQINSIEMYNNRLTVCSAPGFSELFTDDESYIKVINDASRDVDLLLYCVSMEKPKARMDDYDVRTLRYLKRTLNEEVWQHCIVVLTFASAEVTRLEQKKASGIETKFLDKVKMWEDRVKSILTDAGINPTDIPIVPAGVKSRPSLLSRSADIWFSILWHTVYDKATSDGQAVLTVLNASRIKPRSEVGDKDYNSKELYEQPIVPPKTWKDELRVKLPTIAAVLGVGGAAGATGATIGAVIGALAIGIPSFGIAAGLGLVLGGAIGGGAGIGVGVIAAKSIETVKKNTGN